MIDQEMKNQLKSVFTPLESTIELVYNNCSHPDQQQLLDLLSGIAESNTKIQIKMDSNTSSTFPQFRIEKNQTPTGIVFKGIPGGHEFSSLILAILNTDGKGKFPDEGIIQRIKSLQGPIHLRTYISLTCENCPDVVQTLNQIALIHGNMTHEMIDGSYVPDEIKNLGIQGVPSVINGNELLHSGRIQFLDLLNKLEQSFPPNTSINKPSTSKLGHFDVVVIGGGPAGSSAAIYSVRKGLKTALIAERIGGQVQDTKGIENFISVPYTEGPEFSAQLQKHLQSYPIQILEHRRVQSITNDSPKQILFESGERCTAESIILATGAKWRELGIPGEKEYIGRGVAFCPHCDGPYYKGKDVAVIGGGNSGVEAAIDLAGIVKKVTLFEFQDELKADQILVQKLKSLPNVAIITSAKTTSVQGDNQKVNALVYQDRKTDETRSLSLDGVFVQIGLLPNSQFVKGLVETTSFGEIVVDNKGRTSVPGIYAAGDVTTTPFKQIIISMGEGAKAALAAFEDRMHKS